MSADLVTVVIPAYNAAQTIDETLRSVRSQSHALLDIIVVDDGSTDNTVAISQRHAECDARVRVLSQRNGGVARARNAGWHAGRGDLFCFVDADDLWARDKVERQLAALRAAPPGTGLVYSWYALIDTDSNVIWAEPGPEWQDDVLDILLTENFIGNGSSVMVTRRALEDSAGYEPALRDAGAQGCEDMMFYCRVAQHHGFAVAPGHLIGYRVSPGNMSSDLARMLRSWHMVMVEMFARHSDREDKIRLGNYRFTVWLVRRAIFERDLRMLLRVLKVSFRSYRRTTGRIIVTEIPRALREAWESWRGARKAVAAEPEALVRYAIGSSVAADGEVSVANA